MMVNAFGKTNELKIEVLNDVIQLRGQADEAAGKVLQGSVLLNLAEPLKVRTIQLKFTGKMKVQWSEGMGHHQYSHKQERTIITHSWQFVPPHNGHSKKSQLLPAGRHKWDFELMLPGDLPQSLNSDIGRVTYRLKAVVDRPAFHQNLVKKRHIRINRCMLNEFELSQSLEIHNTWADKMVYDISLPTKVYARGESIPISFNILPIANKLKVRSIMATLKEYCTYTANAHSKTDMRIIRFLRQEDPFSEAVLTGETSCWTRVLDMDVPPQCPLIFCDTDNEMIKIRHKLKFIISLENADGHLSELRCAVPVVIIDSLIQQSDLPTYDEAWRSVPYDRAVWDALRSQPTRPHPVSMASAERLVESRQPVTISSWTRSLSVTSGAVQPAQHSISESDESNVDAESEMWWNGVDLSKVPSYQSVNHMDLSLLSCSLPPAYDSLCTWPSRGCR
ncbi:uncharacterized protein BYT42DRAFT_560225 [Radiomyces spectabilis]|uniref:uncharacterized protein n=1 Tax=Radiomyces spectabilis TaxID=64574 RepID=UPI00221FEB03|nr:uncharacterized protein BYT42DRAFT_560225 [Radiomyces spectabilis]KAI8388480.1 hypothetical protein BYT42DRAFT_560225 [Radiomyces spectabilis]